MSKFDALIENRVVQNLCIWFCLYLILIATVQSENPMLVAFYIILLLAPAIYISNVFILPFLKRKRVTFIVLFLLNTIVFTITSVFIIKSSLEQDLALMMFVNFFGILFLALAFAAAIRIARDSFARRQQVKEAELKLLKAQLNPHFLFNTLNNLYGLSVIKSDKLPDLMLKLSDLLRYSLYETKDAYVALEKEIQYLENYIALEKIRLEDTANIQFTKEGNLDSIIIAPMLFIVFVENAFKHLDTTKNTSSKVQVTIRAHENTLFLECINTINPLDSSANSIEKGRSGIGLENARKRLDLLYPDRHTLKVHIDKETFRVYLTLTL